MAVFKLIIPSTRNSGEDEVYRWKLHSINESKIYDMLVDRLRELIPVPTSGYNITYGDENEKYAVKNNADVKRAIEYFKSTNNPDKCVRLYAEPRDEINFVQALDTAMKIIPIISRDNNAVNHASSESDDAATPNSYVIIEHAKENLGAQSKVYDVGCQTDLPYQRNEATPRMRDASFQSDLPETFKKSRNSISIDEECESIYKLYRNDLKVQCNPSITIPVIIPKAVSINDVSDNETSSKKNIGPSYKNRTLEKKEFENEMYQNKNLFKYKTMPSNSTDDLKATKNKLSKEEVYDLCRKLYRMGFRHDERVMKTTIRTYNGDMDAIVDHLSQTT